MSREAELVMVTGENNNKYYKMKEDGNGKFTVRYGRVGGSESTYTYDMHLWDKKFNSKVKKGYKDITSLRATEDSGDATTGLTKMGCQSSQNFLSSLQGWANKSIQHNYTISSSSVTKAQVGEAQKIIDDMATFISTKKKLTTPQITDFNELCTNLYMTIPRKMGKVQDYILHGNHQTVEFASDLVTNEQDTLDVMAQQVELHKSDKKTVSSGNTLADALGISIEPASDVDITKIKKLMGSSSNRFKSAYAITSNTGEIAYQKQLKKSHGDATQLLWHGSRNENWLNIIKTGLLIRPSGVVLTGAMFGNGIYFANKAQKSIGYTSSRGSYWTGGSSACGYLALYDVNTGVECVSKRHTSYHYRMDYKNLQALGKYDCLYAKGGIDLRNDEIIIYQAPQCTIKYIVEIS